MRVGRDGASAVFANTAHGIAQLGDSCRTHRADLVTMEATGGYERQTFALLSEQGLGVAILNPRAVRRFAEGMGVLEKTDGLDAGMIAWFAEVKGALPTASRPKLRALVTRLRQLTDMQTAQKNQARLVSDPAVLASFTELLGLLKQQMRQLESAIKELIVDDPLWQHLDPALWSVKGVAGRTVARLMAEMPEIGTVSGKAISKLAGVAPLESDSGKHQGKRHVRGGRAAVREILFVVAGAAGRYEPDFIAFRERLAAAGKPRKVIRIALAHKLLKALVRRITSHLGLRPRLISGRAVGARQSPVARRWSDCENAC